MYDNLSIVYDKLMDVDYSIYKSIIDERLNSKNNQKILDLGCGSGTLIECLSKYGKVYAADNNENMLSLARNKNSNAEFFLLDLLEITKLEEKFNFIISSFDVFNYLLDFSEFKKGLIEVYNSLENDGEFIFDIHTPNKINYMIEQKVFAYEDFDISYLWFTYETEKSNEVESEITFFIKQKNNLYKKIEEFQKQRAYEIDLVFETLKKIGFKINNYFCDFDRKNKNYKNADRVIFILKKENNS